MPKCKDCKAYGIDDLRFHGCLIKHTMEDLPNGTVGCRRHKATITREIEKAKETDPRSKYYKWR